MVSESPYHCPLKYCFSRSLGIEILLSILWTNSLVIGFLRQVLTLAYRGAHPQEKTAPSRGTYWLDKCGLRIQRIPALNDRNMLICSDSHVIVTHGFPQHTTYISILSDWSGPDFPSRHQNPVIGIGWQ